MSTEDSKKKSGRTPEQQAARDARKAAKAAAAAAVSTSTSEEPAQPHAESSKQAVAATSPQPRIEKKRRRSEREDGQDQAEAEKEDEKEGETVNEEDLLEIDVDAPEPLSKAEARAARKRQKKGLPDLPPKITKPDKPKKHDSDDEDDAETSEKKEEKKPKQRMNSVWIGNLSFRTTAESLKTYLEKGITEIGAVGHGAVTRVNLPKKPGKGEFAPNRGFAYVDFATPELQDLGVALSETFFEGRKLLIKKGDDHTVKPDARTPRPERAKLDPMAASILKKQIHPESATLFVGNLPFDATEEALRDMIEEHAAEIPAPVAPEPATEDDPAPETVAETGAEGTEGGEADDATSEEKKVEAVNLRGGKKSGLRKVRLGAFEDTGRCKGFAFLDFHSPQEATKTLVNRKNHFFGNRKLNVQYASESATKRSGGNRNQEPTGAPKPKRYSAAPADGADGTSTSEAPTYAGPPEPAEDDKKKDHRGKRWEASGRPRPGAALAMAKREKVGIVKAEGAKIVFD